MAELADAMDLGSIGEILAGSTPVVPTKFSRVFLVFQIEPELVRQFVKTQMPAKTVLQMKHRSTMDANHHMRALSSTLRLQFHQIESYLAAAFLFFHRVHSSLRFHIFKFSPRLLNSQFISKAVSIANGGNALSKKRKRNLQY